MDHAKTSPRTHTHPRWHLTGRALAVFGVSFSFLVMMISGLVLFVAPRGRTALEIDWQLLGLARDGWEGLHLATAFLFIAFVAWHFLIHLRVYATLWSGTPIHPAGHRKEAWIAGLAVLLIAVTALAMWPPSSWAIDTNEFFKKQYWDPAGSAARH